MTKKVIIVFLVGGLALAGWLAYYFSDKQVVRRQLVALAVELGKGEEETMMQMALKLRSIKDMLAPSCRVSIVGRQRVENLEPDLIIRYLIFYRQRYAVLTVELADMEITIPAKGEALVRTMAVLSRMVKVDEEAVVERHQVEIGLVKGEKNWLLRQANLPQALVE